MMDTMIVYLCAPTGHAHWFPDTTSDARARYLIMIGSVPEWQLVPRKQVGTWGLEHVQNFQSIRFNLLAYT